MIHVHLKTFPHPKVDKFLSWRLGTDRSSNNAYEHEGKNIERTLQRLGQLTVSILSNSNKGKICKENAKLSKLIV